MYSRIDSATKLLICSLIKSAYMRVIQMIMTLIVLGIITHNQVWAENIEKAVALDKKAKAAYSQGNINQAIDLYQEALRNFKHPDLLLRLSALYTEKRRFRDAFDLCSEALKSKLLTDENKLKADLCIQESEINLKQIWAYIESNPKGAKIRLDGRSVGYTPWKGILIPGRRQFDLELQGYHPISRSINAVPGAEVVMKMRLIPLGLGGLLSIETVPQGSSIMLDNQFIGSAPIRSFPVTAGAHDLQVILADYLTEKRNIYISEGKTTETMIYLNPKRGQVSAKDLWPAWTLIGLGVVTATLGGVFGYQALNSREKANSLATSDATAIGRIKYDQELNNMNTYRNTSDILWVTSILSLTGGFTWWGLSR
jgi:tetratricopeptide (TPR) repeat protein